MSELDEGVKHDGGKVRHDLLSPWFLEEVSRVLTSGAEKYEPHNWAKGIKKSRLLGACLRHIFAYLAGEKNDPEWGYPHLAHAACCLMFLIHQDAAPTMYAEFDDLPKWKELPA